MTLDKAIEIYEIVASIHERDAEYHRPLGHSHESIANVAEMQAREERQFAEWLKELKAYRETYPYGVDRFNGSDTPQTDWYYTDATHFGKAKGESTTTNTADCERYVVVNDEGEKVYNCIGCQTDCPWK